jgi:hypothetical protein
MTNYSKEAVEYALKVISEETEEKAEEILRDSYTAFSRIDGILRDKIFNLRKIAGCPAMRAELAAIVLYAAAALYEWDKSSSG